MNIAQINLFVPLSATISSCTYRQMANYYSNIGDSTGALTELSLYPEWLFVQVGRRIQNDSS